MFGAFKATPGEETGPDLGWPYIVVHAASFFFDRQPELSAVHPIRCGLEVLFFLLFITNLAGTEA
jgi:hypothetical protein